MHVATRRLLFSIPLLLSLVLSDVATAVAQEEQDAPSGRPAKSKLKVEVETKLALRHSRALAFRLKTPVPPEFLRPGEDALYLRTPDAGTSLELSDVNLALSYDFSPHIRGKVKAHAVDLDNRNPTSSTDRLFVREAWLRFGGAPAPFEPLGATSAYLQLGLAPRFTKQLLRQLESYGLWGTAFGRLELFQAQLGGNLGSSVYWRAHVARRNPLFMRDPNALAGDNGTDRRVPGNNNPELESGFPILYDTYSPDLTGRGGEVELGGGLGVRLLDAEGRNGIDVLAWGFDGQLAETVDLRHTFYGGDLDLLDATGGPLPVTGDRKRDLGATLTARWNALQLYGQYIDQDIAGLHRSGFETELAVRVPLGGVFVSGDQPVLNWVRFVVRFSNIDNHFAAPTTFVVPSMAWDWRKYDFGVRIGVLKDIDVTVEYARHDMITAKGTLHPDETLVTLRFAM